MGNGSTIIHHSEEKRKNKFLVQLLESYREDTFKKSYFEESKRRKIGLCNLAIQELERYFFENDLHDPTVKKKYNTDEDFKNEYETKVRDLRWWKMQLNETENKQWHGVFCGDGWESIVDANLTPDSKTD